jgi:hypothetical protein
MKDISELYGLCPKKTDVGNPIIANDNLQFVADGKGPRKKQKTEE